MGQPEKATLHCQAVAVERPKNFDVEIDPLYRVNPKYPPSKARNGQGGYVLVEFDVDTNEITKDIKVIDSSSNIFEKNSLQAVSKWRYAPSVKDGELIITEGARMRIEYRIAR